MSEFEQKMARSDLPQEIWIDIFSRLPSKSIGKCRCLGKQWHALLSTPQFIKSHLNRNSHEENIILIASSGSLHTIVTNIEGDIVSKKLELPDNWEEIVGSCDGFVLLMNGFEEKVLLNPITQQHLKIPDSPLALKKGESISMHGFGYDSLGTDYKIVTLSYYHPGAEFEPDCNDTFVDVYSVKRGVWKRVDNSRYDHAYLSPSPGVFVNGAIHWLADSGEPGRLPVIVAFNFAHEVFDEIPAPNDADVGNFVFGKLGILGGHLCMSDPRSLDVWIMEEYGVVDSWTKFSIELVDYCLEMNKPLCYLGDEELVLMEVDGLNIYNMQDKSFELMVVDGAPDFFRDASIYVESLVSPTTN